MTREDLSGWPLTQKAEFEQASGNTLPRMFVDGRGCWISTQRPDTNGYVRWGLNGPDKNKLVQRVIWETFNGPVPAGLVLDHLCRVRCCVNPSHLEPVTDRVNILRGVGPTALNAKKTHCKHGHEFTESNTGHNAKGRYCKTCGTAYWKVNQPIRRARLRALRAAARKPEREGGGE